MVAFLSVGGHCFQLVFETLPGIKRAPTAAAFSWPASPVRITCGYRAANCFANSVCAKAIVVLPVPAGPLKSHADGYGFAANGVFAENSRAPSSHLTVHFRYQTVHFRYQFETAPSCQSTSRSTFRLRFTQMIAPEGWL